METTMDSQEIISLIGQIVAFLVPLIGGGAGMIAAYVTLRGQQSSSKHEERRIDLDEKRIGHEEKRLETQETFEFLSAVERAQQMIVQLADRQNQQINQLEIKIQQLREEVEYNRLENKRLKGILNNMFKDIDTLIYDFKKLPIDQRNCENLVIAIGEVLSKTKKENGF